MATKNPAQIQEGLEQVVQAREPWPFIERFLQTFGFPKSTITRIAKGDRQRNVAPAPEAGEVALKNQLYFAPRELEDEALYEEAERLRDAALVQRHGLRFVLVTNFQELVAYDRRAEERLECALEQLPRHFNFFLPLIGYEKVETANESEADVKAARKMAQLCDLLRQDNAVESVEQRHALYVFLARLLFCLFAEDTGIFVAQQFTDALRRSTARDGSDSDDFLEQLFEVLNTPAEARSARTPAHLAGFPYVNGGLFREPITPPEFSGRTRRMLIDAGNLDWSGINPDIFGSMFQTVVDPEQRGALGQHYTSESNILKVLRPLFLDALRDELGQARGSEKRLKALLVRLSRIKVFDPACGSGNFLVTAYKELRRIELEALQALRELGVQLDLMLVGNVRLHQFYGIEIDDFACETARLALWLSEHQVNQQFQEQLGEAPPTLPLTTSAQIEHGNALRMDWAELCAPDEEEVVYIASNPPFNGHQSRTSEQKEDMRRVFRGFHKHGHLDFVASWIWLGAQYLARLPGQADAGFVATSSVCQGEQVAMLWPAIFERGVHIHYGYPGFPWRNNARDNAGVHVAILGLTATPPARVRLYQRLNAYWHALTAEGISPYLVRGPETAVVSRSKPFRDAARMAYGNMPNDGGYLILTAQEREMLLQHEPDAAPWIKRLMGADEFIKGKQRWCLWLAEASEADLDAMPAVRERVERVREKRLSSNRETTRERANTPHLFGEVRCWGDKDYLLVPSVTSERRDYVPIGFFDANVIPNNLVHIIPNAGFYEFGLLSSMMHMDWLRLVGGRLESRYRYSAKLVYNTFPWPEITEQQRAEIESLAEEVLLAREDTFDWTMGEMYDPDHMPSALREAHRALDRAVERLYRDKLFRDREERQAYLLARYEELAREEGR